MSVPRAESTESGQAAHLHEFWNHYFRLGFAILAAESAASFVYFLLTATARDLDFLLGIASASCLSASVMLVFVRRLAAKSWRAWFSLGWTVATTVVLTVCAGLDGGIDSNLLYLAVLPMISAALALRTWAVALSGICTLFEFLVLMVTDRNVTSDSSSLVILFSVTIGVVVIAVASAANRERLQANEDRILARISELADTDPLTNCRNHRVFDMTLRSEAERAARYGHDLSLVVVDVDRFKSYNDLHGHPEGDAALIRVAGVLCDSVRTSDTVARIGGDEFALVLPATPLAEAAHAADRIRAALGDPSVAGVTVSVGVAELDRSEPTAAKLFRDADADLYRAKSTRPGLQAALAT
jgi:diguanylate cyclase (GGDEF)-like protein